MALLDGIDLTNPCQVWPQLQAAYYSLLAGETEARVRFREREVELTQASLPALQREIERLKAECERKQGRRARYAIRAGFRRRGFGPGTGYGGDFGDGFNGL
jgi:uncharacterized small protein (DUF1192 family)